MMINRQSGFKIYMSKILVAASFVLFFFSIVFITIAYNVSSMKLAMSNNLIASAADLEKLRERNPDFFTFASLEVKLPAGPLPIPAGGTFEAYLNKMYPQRNISDWSFRYAIAANAGVPGKLTDETYVNSFFNLNSAFERAIVSSYDRPFGDNSVETEFHITSDKNGVLYQHWLNSCLNLLMVSRIGGRALDKKDYAMALMSDLAYLRFSAAERNLGAQHINNIIDYNLYHEYAMSKDIFIDENAYFAGGAELSDKFRTALMKRVEFIKKRPNFAYALKNTVGLLKMKLSGLAMKDKATFYALNLWYGDPDAPFIEVAEKIYAKKDSPCAEFEKIIAEAREKYPIRRNFTTELAYTGDDLLSILKFIKFAINTHPLAPASYMPAYELKQFIYIETRLRLITFGGLARLFYAENKRWPDPAKDLQFMNEAGPAAIDIYTNKPFKIISGKNGDYITIQSEVKEWYDPVKKMRGFVQIEADRPF